MATVACVRNQHIYSVRRPRKSRTKSGCLACRARRKKCDEQKPVCRSCDRLQLSCSWPVAASNEDSVVRSSSMSKPQPTQPLQVSATTETKDILQTASSCFSDGDRFDILSLPKEAPSVEPRDVGQNHSGVFPHKANVAPKVHDLIFVSHGPEAAMLFDHFCLKTAPWLINGSCDKNPVLRHIVPLIITDDLVLCTVLAISGTHLHHSRPSITATAVKYYSSAFHRLKQRLSGWLSSSEKDYKPLFATIILLCHCEVSI